MGKISLNAEQKKDLFTVLSNGYSANSALIVMNQKYPNLNLKVMDIIVLSKSMGIRNIGNKDITKEDINSDMIGNALPNVLNDNTMMSKIKNSLLIILLCLIAVVVAIGLFTNWKISLIVGGCLLSIIIVAIILLYCKFVKGNDMIKGLIKEKVIKNKKKNT